MDILKKPLCLLVLLMFTAIPLSLATPPPPNPVDMTTICYLDPSDPRTENTRQVTSSSILNFMQQGSFLGSCSTPDNTGTTQICFVPASSPIDAYTTVVSNKRLQAFLLYGSFLGPCSKGDKDHKITICHIPPGNPANAHTIDIDRSALYTHMSQHGDYVGPCEPKNSETCEKNDSSGSEDSSENDHHDTARRNYAQHNSDDSRSKSHTPGGSLLYKICHNPADNGGITISVRDCQLIRHLKHGDYMGSCLETPATPRPSTGTPSTATPSTARPSTATPSTATPSTATPSTATPSTATPSTATPSTATPSTATPSTARPSTGTPSDAPAQTVIIEDVYITICHIPEGAPQNAYEISIPRSSLLAYLLAGDQLGLCPEVPARCGDGIVNGQEQCDTILESATCNADCTVPVCGDRITNLFAGEICDAGTRLNNTYCLDDCTWARCGDGYPRLGIEQCDTKGFSATCNNDCTLTRCGDGVLNIAAGEQCDDSNTAAGDGCSPTCQLETRCGDGIKQGCEECDMGIDNGWDKFCLPNCKKAKCRDGYIFAGFEECDDGNSDNTDSCLNNCRTATCGDSILQIGTEECDRGLNNNTAYCLNTCILNACGDGYIRTDTEECDLGELNSNSGLCTKSCHRNRCGDGFVHIGEEECDTGLLSWTGTCLPGCKSAKCGDGYVQKGVEACDQGVLNGNGPGYCKMDCSGIQKDKLSKHEIIGISVGSVIGAAMITTIGVLAWKYSVLKNAAHWYVNKFTAQK